MRNGWIETHIWESTERRAPREVFLDNITSWFASHHEPFPEFSTASQVPFWNSHLPKASRTSSPLVLIGLITSCLSPQHMISAIIQCFSKHGIYIYTYFRWHVYNESCPKEVISLSSPCQALYYKVLLFFHFLLVFYLNWVDSDSKDVADNSIQLKFNTIILLSSL